MKVTLVYGFLGAGKTTLLRHLLPQLAARERVALLVNEFGDVGIDGEVLAGGDVRVKEMASGCICCALIGDMTRAVLEIHRGWQPDRLIVEPTGVAAPQPLAHLFSSAPLDRVATLDRVVTVVDAARFAASRAVFAAFYVEQIRHADALVLNKVDRASPEEVAAVERALRETNPAAEIHPTTFARVPLDWLVGDGQPRLRPQEGHGHVEDSASGLAAHTVRVGCPPRAVLEGVLTAFDTGRFGEIVRAKGFVETPEGALHVEYVPGQVHLEPYAGEQRALVVAGRGVDADAIAAALASGA